MCMCVHVNMGVFMRFHISNEVSSRITKRKYTIAASIYIYASMFMHM